MQVSRPTILVLLMVFFIGFFASAFLTGVTAQSNDSTEDAATESFENQLVDWLGIGLPGYGASAATEACANWVLGGVNPCPIKKAYHDNVIITLNNLIPVVETACADIDLFCSQGTCPKGQTCIGGSNGCNCEANPLSGGLSITNTWKTNLPPWPTPTTGAGPTWGGTCGGAGSDLPNDLAQLKKAFEGTGYDVSGIDDIDHLKNMICASKICDSITAGPNEVCTEQPQCIPQGEKKDRCLCTGGECGPFTQETPVDTEPPGDGPGPGTGGPNDPPALGGACAGSTQHVTDIYELMEAAGYDMSKYNHGGGVDNQEMLADYCGSKNCPAQTGDACQQTCVNDPDKEVCHCVDGSCGGDGNDPTDGGDDSSTSCTFPNFTDYTGECHLVKSDPNDFPGCGTVLLGPHLTSEGEETFYCADSQINQLSCGTYLVAPTPGVLICDVSSPDAACTVNAVYSVAQSTCIGTPLPTTSCDSPNFTYNGTCYHVTPSPSAGCMTSYYSPTGHGYVCASDYTSQGLPGYIAHITDYTDPHTGTIIPYYYAVDDAAGVVHCQYNAVDSSPDGNPVCIDPPLTACVTFNEDGSGCSFVGQEINVYPACGSNVSTVDADTNPACLIPGSSSDPSMQPNAALFVLPCVEDVCTIRSEEDSSQNSSTNNPSSNKNPLDALWDLLNQFFG